MSNPDPRSDAHNEALDKLADVHRGWCNYCRGDALACLNAPPGGCSLRDYMISLDAIRPTPPTAKTTTDAIIEQYRGASQRGLAIALADHARFLEADVAHWKRMYECAQNANAYRQDALDAPQSESGWIACSDKRPAPLTTCLFTDGELFSSGYLDPQGFWCMDINFHGDPAMGPTHWMPLPAAPSPTNEDGK